MKYRILIAKGNGYEKLTTISSEECLINITDNLVYEEKIEKLMIITEDEKGSMLDIFVYLSGWGDETYKNFREQHQPKVKKLVKE